ncbi:MAG: hypothetical protein K6E68_09140 [Lachnospiraceae bacterium]|nr:hypothetical protein [Lachnospiraceae bacterium]
MITVAEIIILIVGAILFTVSFIIPDKRSGLSVDADGYVDEDAIREVVDDELKKAKESIEEATKLSISDSKDKLERYMDRLTNEKMMAVGEYSDTVMEQIHKDHEEAVFLYDMIDNKHSQVKNTAAELGQLEKDVRRLSESVKTKGDASDNKQAEAVAAPKAHASGKRNESKPVEEKKDKKTEVFDADFSALSPDKVSVSEPDIPEVKTVAPADELGAEVLDAKDAPGPMAGDSVELLFDSDSNSMNNNGRILSLHKAGKSNMAIAKELGLGVGEVKLVIDLFKN